MSTDILALAVAVLGPNVSVLKQEMTPPWPHSGLPRPDFTGAANARSGRCDGRYAQLERVERRSRTLHCCFRRLRGAGPAVAALTCTTGRFHRLPSYFIAGPRGPKTKDDPAVLPRSKNLETGHSRRVANSYLPHRKTP